MNDYKITDISVGMVEFFNVRVTEEMLEKFYNITADYSPIHMDEKFAKSRGLKGRVVYGMLTASFFSTLVGVYLPGSNALLHGINATFHKPVYIGQELKIKGEVTYVNEVMKQIEIKGSAMSLEGEVFSKAKLKVGVHE
jgi:3-hydroxybutyryl-CoA dehydratase